MKYALSIFVVILATQLGALSIEVYDTCSPEGQFATSSGSNLKQPVLTPSPTPPMSPFPAQFQDKSKKDDNPGGKNTAIASKSFLETANLMTKQRLFRSIEEVCPQSYPVTARILREYGAIYVSESQVVVPYRCILDNEDDVQAFQQVAKRTVELIGGVQVALQKPAMDALIAARREAAKKGLSITPRGGLTASTRSYSATLGLWKSRFIPGLNHWVKKGRIKREEAIAAQNSPIDTQIAMVLQWEAKGIYFSKDLSKSILYSVAAPGASQHIFMVALDVTEFGNKTVRQILADHGWFQTVKSDLPHFTYLGGV